jgi:ribosomal protein S25
MRYEHKAIIDAANRDGKSPSEIAHELLGHDLLKAMVTAISKPAVAFSKMSEQQQQGLIEDLTKELVPAISTAIGVICSNNTHTVRMKLKKMAVGTNYQITGQVDKTQDFIHELMDKTHDQSDVLIVLHERDYLQGLDGIQAEKDQKALPLDTEPTKEKKPRATKAKDEPKPIELPPALIDQAEEFVVKQQNTKVAALQNQFKINIDKGQALLAALEERGIVTAADEKGERQLVREKPADATATDSSESAIETPADTSSDGHHLDTDANGFVIMSDELVALATAKVRKDGKVSKGALAVTYDLDDTVADQLIDRLELEGVISPEDDLGGREIITVQ